MSASKGKHGPLIGAIDQGTSSSRFLVFAAETAELLTYHQEEVRQFLPQEGWVEQDPLELLSSVEKCIEQTVKNLIALDIDPGDIVAVGITNQRETTIVWDKETGEVLHNAIVWLDSRTKETVDTFLAKVPNRNMDVLKDKTGLPLSTYFSAFKMRWLLDKIGPVQEAVAKKTACFGTVDSWLIWNLSGGVAGGLHMTDVTNASRTMLMNIHTLQWDPELCKFFQIPSTLLPVIKSSSEIYCHVSQGSLKGVPISGCLGDQQAALVGQLCLSPGQAKNTYGTGCFLLYNTGTEAVVSQHGLLTTVAYQWEGESPCYALEGSVAVAGGVVRWLRDNLQLLDDIEQIQSLAASVTDTGGVYFVPAFSGLYAPYWRMDARGVLCGLTQFTTRAHIARAALEAVCFQTKDLIEAMKHDTEVALSSLKVDGGMPSNDLLMQLQADILGIPILRPCMMETTSLGVAIAAGRALGVWKIPHESTTEDMAVDKFSPQISERNRDTRYGRWKDAVARTLGWEVTAETTSTSSDAHERRIKALPGIGFTFVSFCLCILADYLQCAISHS